MTGLARHFAYLFRQAADQLAAIPMPDRYTPLPDGSRLVNHRHHEGPAVPSKLLDHLGRLVIEAAEAGLVTDPEILQAIEWNTASGENDPKPGGNGPMAVPVRCPINLWWRVVGGGEETYRLIDGKLQLAKSPKTGTHRTGGILPKSVPGLLRMTRRDRHVAACRMLADMMSGEPKPFESQTHLTQRTAVPPFVVDCENRQVVIHGQPFAVTETQAKYLAHLLSMNGEWQSARSLCKENPAFESENITRVRTSLPEPVQAMLETSRNKGTRIKRLR